MRMCVSDDGGVVIEAREPILLNTVFLVGTAMCSRTLIKLSTHFIN